MMEKKNLKYQLDLYLFRMFRYLSVFLLIFMMSNLFAQSIICNYCKNPIKGNYITAEGKYYHQEHFLCAACRKPISGNFYIDQDKFYHPDCYRDNILEKCAFCGQPIEDRFISKDGKSYHEKCYNDNIAEKCAVCSLPLLGKYLIDSYNNKYHERHENEYKKCSNCSRLICPSITRGGKIYSDGRNICSICYNEAVNGTENIKRIFRRVAEKLNEIGLNLDLSNCSVRAVDLDQLKSEAAENYDDNLKGYCKVKSVTTTVDDLTTFDRSFSIFILDGIPKTYIGSTISHELMHVWIAQNCSNKLNMKLEEGSCNYISYLYLRKYPAKYSIQIIKGMEQNPSPVYGDGFREVKRRFNNKPLFSLLNYLKNR